MLRDKYLNFSPKTTGRDRKKKSKRIESNRRMSTDAIWIAEDASFRSCLIVCVVVVNAPTDDCVMCVSYVCKYKIKRCVARTIMKWYGFYLRFGNRAPIQVRIKVCVPRSRCHTTSMRVRVYARARECMCVVRGLVCMSYAHRHTWTSECLLNRKTSEDTHTSAIAANGCEWERHNFQFLFRNFFPIRYNANERWHTHTHTRAHSTGGFARSFESILIRIFSSSLAVVTTWMHAHIHRLAFNEICFSLLLFLSSSVYFLFSGFHRTSHEKKRQKISESIEIGLHFFYRVNDVI